MNPDTVPQHKQLVNQSMEMPENQIVASHPETDTPTTKPKSFARAVFLQVCASVLVFTGLWYVSDIVCLSDNRDTHNKCEIYRTVAVGVVTFGVFLYGFNKIQRDRKAADLILVDNNDRTSALKPGTDNKRTLKTGLALCFMPLVSLVIFNILSFYDIRYEGNQVHSGSIASALYPVIVLLSIAIIPCFIAGVVLIYKAAIQK